MLVTSQQPGCLKAGRRSESQHNVLRDVVDGPPTLPEEQP